MPTKYRMKRLTPAEFRALMKEAGMNVNDLIYLTGRSSPQVLAFMDSDRAGHPPPFQPVMADAMILELAARYPKVHAAMKRIADEYSLGGDGK